MKSKLNKNEWSWIVYDVGNSAFTLLVCTIIPIYFNGIAGAAGLSDADYVAYWSYATSIATAVVALLGPFIGTVADFKGAKKKIFSVSVLIGVIGCVALSFISAWIWFLALFIVAKAAYSISLVAYDSMLTDVTVPEKMDEVSSKGFAWGYIGSCVPFGLSLVPVLLSQSGVLSTSVAMPIAFIIIAVWWAAFSIPLWKTYKQTYYVASDRFSAAAGFKNLGATFKEILHRKKILLFLIAFFFYIDGVYTIIDEATTFGTALGLDTTWLLIALLVTQVVAFPSAILLGKLAQRIKNEYIIGGCIIAYLAISVYAIFLKEIYQFWILAVCVGMFQGTIQALSRSYFAKIIPSEKSGEYFGVYDVFGKGASFLGTFLVGVISDATDNPNYAVGSLAIMFAIGFSLFIIAARVKSDDKEKAFSLLPPEKSGESE